MLLNHRLNGGGRFDLTGKERLAYLWRCDKITCKCKVQTDSEIGISGNLVILFDFVKKVIEGSKAADKKKYLDLLDQIQTKKAPFTVKILNLKSLQCVILMTMLLIETEKIADDKLMASYPPQFKIKDLFKSLITGNLWLDLDKLEAECLKERQLKQLPKKFPRPTDFMEILKGTTPVEYCDDIIDVRLAVLLGELSLEEIVESELNFVHLLGITSEMEWADGRLYTPFEFLHHDLVHAENITNSVSPSLINRISNLYKHIKSKKTELGKKYHDFIIILFLLVHESFNIGEVFSMKTIPTMADVSAGSSFIDTVDNWMNPKFFGGLLPPEIQGKRDQIIPYLNTSLKDLFELLKKFEEKKGGGNTYYTKYMKYKNKYTQLKNQIQNQ